MFKKNLNNIWICCMCCIFFVANAHGYLVPGEGSGGGAKPSAATENPPQYEPSKPDKPVAKPVTKPTPKKDDYLVPGYGSGGSSKPKNSKPNPPQYNDSSYSDKPYDSHHSDYGDGFSWIFPSWPKWPKQPPASVTPPPVQPPIVDNDLILNLQPSIYGVTVNVSQIILLQSSIKQGPVKQVALRLAYYAAQLEDQKNVTDLYATALTVNRVPMAGRPQVIEIQKKFIKEYGMYMFEFDVLLPLVKPTQIDFQKQMMEVHLLGSAEVKQIAIDFVN